jgi:hypothetical protein
MHFRLLKKHQDSEKPRRIALSLILRHVSCLPTLARRTADGNFQGDVLIMEGSGVQTFYEHTVIPCNFRIAATARFIDSSSA